MRRKGGIGNQITSILGTLIAIGIIYAILLQFDMDVVALFAWIADWAIGVVVGVADWLTGQDGFRSLFR